MYYVMRASAPSLHRESTDSLMLEMQTLHIATVIIMWLIVDADPISMNNIIISSSSKNNEKTSFLEEKHYLDDTSSPTYV